MKKQLNHRLTLSLHLALIAFLVSCGNPVKELKEVGIRQEIQADTGRALVEFCTIDPTQIDTKVKILLSVDYTGSNVIFHGNNPVRPPTDPDRIRRHVALQDWLSRRQSDPYEYFSYLWFTRNESQLSAAFSEDIHPDYPFISDPIQFRDEIVEYERTMVPDNGATPFKAALNKIVETIRFDAEKARQKHIDTGEIDISHYIIGFISDGIPTDVDPANPQEIYDIIRNELMTLPQDPILGSYISQVILNTGYYYYQVNLPEAQAIMSRMAQEGQGDFYVYDDNDIIDFDQMTDVLVKKVTTKLTDVIVTNTNTNWDIASRSLLPDSDGDGLPDVVELLLGSDPFKVDSDDNGVSDGVEFIIDRQSRPCRDPNCDPARAHAVAGCFDTEGDPIDSDGDGLLDCEERLLGSDPNKFDTNGNGLPDPLSLKFGLPLTRQDNDNRPSPPADSVDSDRDGLSDLDEVRLNSSPLIRNSELEGLVLQEYDQKMISYNPFTQVGCYELVVDNIYMSSSEDTIRVYLMENETTQTGRKFLRIVDKKAQGGRVHFTREDFAEAKLLK